MAMRLGLRFDFRNPAFAGTSMADRYDAALDMAEWSESLGIPVSLTISEHHGSDDGYIPSPQLMLAAMAARTKTAQLRIAALIAPYHDPLRIAEDYCVLDNLSRGRIEMIVAAGYAPHEFEMFGVPIKERVKRVVEMVATLKGAFSGKPFLYRGRTVHVTPEPFRTGGPKVILGGSSEPAARRAAHIADGFQPTHDACWGFYRDEMVKLGKADPGPKVSQESSVHVLGRNPAGDWDERASFFLHETNAYGKWREEAQNPGQYDVVDDYTALKATGRYTVFTPSQYVAKLKEMQIPNANFHPLCGGMPIDLAWDSLRLFEQEVLPAFR
jgi:alkanesulfonate monooxygenase SsuD/methylene tetrahydromethanopterin reductase-like flavin-dependent oxidoreductase (luciferase family)